MPAAGNFALGVSHPCGFPPAVRCGGGVPRFSTAPLFWVESPEKQDFEGLCSAD